MTQKSGQGDDFNFRNAIFLAFLVVVKTNDIFWNPETKLDNIGMFLKGKNTFQNLTFSDVNLA